MYFSIVALVLTEALISGVCHSLNVTVTPGPTVLVSDRDNLTLSCLVSQRKRSSSVLILRWFFSPPAAPTPQPGPSAPPLLQPSHFLIVKLGIKKLKLYGNYTRQFPQAKFRLHEDTEGEAYRLRILAVTGTDQGFYTCKVQEICKHRNTWRASSNGTGTTQITVHLSPEDQTSGGLALLFADVYLCAVLLCCLGLLSILLFSLALAVQHLLRRHRRKATYLLVKCPESSSGETVTSSSSCSSSSPPARRKEPNQNHERRATVKPPKAPQQPLPPPHAAAKVPGAVKRPVKPRRSKLQPKRSPGVDDALTYAELELVRPRPLQRPPASCSPEPPADGPDTVYAQILFQERRL